MGIATTSDFLTNLFSFITDSVIQGGHLPHRSITRWLQKCAVCWKHRLIVIALIVIGCTVVSLCGRPWSFSGGKRVWWLCTTVIVEQVAALKDSRISNYLIGNTRRFCREYPCKQLICLADCLSLRGINEELVSSWFWEVTSHNLIEVLLVNFLRLCFIVMQDPPPLDLFRRLRCRDGFTIFLVFHVFFYKNPRFGSESFMLLWWPYC